MQNDQNINRVLLSSINLYNDEYLIEKLNDLISMGACKIGIINTERTDKIISSLNPKLQDRIIIVDRDKSCFNHVKSFLEPLANIYKLRIIEEGKIEYSQRVSHDTGSALSSLCFNYYKFILSKKYKMQVDIKLANFLKWIEYLRNQLHYKRDLSSILDFKTQLASLHYIIKSYEKKETDRIRFISTATEEQIDIFNNLLSDDSYIKLSTEALKLGEVGNKEALNNFIKTKNRFFRKIFSQFFTISELSIALNLFIFKMKADLKTSEVKEEYLPPIVNLNT